MKTVHVSFFAAFREQAGREQCTVETEARDAAALFEELRGAYPGLARYDAMKFAINDELCARDTPLGDGDRVLYFPPVAGG